MAGEVFLRSIGCFSLVFEMGLLCPLLMKPSLGRDDPLEKEMAAHSSLLAWRVPRTEEPGGLQSMGSRRVGHE